jgi:hypothetical protein
MKTITSLILLILMVGCATNKRRPFDHVEMVSPLGREAYIFARLDMDESVFLTSNNWLELENLETGKRFLIKFEAKRKVVAVKATPGNYRFIGMVHTPGGPLSWAMESEVTKIPLNSKIKEFQKAIKIENGKVYYLGDFYSFQSRDRMMILGPIISGSFSYGFSFEGYDCEAATEEFVDIFPGSNRLEFECVYEISEIEKQIEQAKVEQVAAGNVR